MIRARAGNLVILGLLPDNVARLKGGEPILVKLGELGVPDARGAAVLLVYGDTPAAIMEEIERHTGLITPAIDAVVATAAQRGPVCPS